MAWRGWLGRLVVLSAVGSGALGCDAQVGDEYTGDVMFTVRGHVNAPPDNHADLVPAIGMFRAAPADAVETPIVVDLMAGEVEGIFPSDFRLSVSEAPELNGWPMALGALMLVPRGLPSSLEMAQSSSYRVVSDGELAFRDPEPFEPFVELQEHCRASGECVERRQECVLAPCEVIATFGDRPTEPVEGDPTYSESGCKGGFCYHTSIDCYHDPTCFRELIQCDVSTPGSVRQGNMVKTCSLLSETGDTSIRSLSDIVVAQNKLVLYSVQAGDTTAIFPIDNLKSGYNLVDVSAASSSDDWLRISSCRFDAKFQALREHNRARGRNDRYEDLSGDDLANVQLRSDELTHEECPVWQVIEDPAGVLLDLDLSRGAGW